MSNSQERLPSTQSSTSLPPWFLAVVTVPILIALLWYGREFLMPLAITILLVVLINAVVDKVVSIEIGGWHTPRWLAHIICFALVVLAAVLLGAMFSNQAGAISEAGPRYEARLKAIMESIQSVLGADIVAAAERSVQKIDFAAWAAGFLNSAGGALSSIILILLYLGFFMAEQAGLDRKILSLSANKENAAHITKVARAITDGVKQYMWINTVTSAMSGVVAYVIFSLVGLDFAAPLALFVFIAGFIPGIGAFIAITFPSMLALLQFDTITPFLIVLIGYGLADQFISNVIQPAMQGKSLSISSFMVMVSLTFWSLMWGAIGAFLAVPIMVVVMIVCAEIPSLRAIAVILSSDGVLPGDGDELRERNADAKA